MSWFTNLYAAMEPILPGFVVAALFICLLTVLRLKFRGAPLAARFKRPITIFYLYILLFVLAVTARLYLSTFYRILNLFSLSVLTLAIILSLSVGVFDLFLTKYRKVQVPAILKDLVILGVYVVMVVIVIGQEGVDVTSLVTTSAVLTAVIGFALQDLLSNIISGLAIEVEHSFEVGHWVKFNDLEGRVVEINWRSTKIQTLDNDYVIIPNAVATRSPMTNYSSPSKVHRHRVQVGLEYAVPPGRAKESLLRAMEGIEGVLPKPPPHVEIHQFEDSSISYNCYFYIDDFHNHKRIEDRVKTRIWYQLGRDNLTIPFPIRDVTLRQIDGSTEARNRAGILKERVALLSKIPFLKTLTPEELEELAELLSQKRYTKGETIITQGDRGESFFLIASGEVDVRVRKEDPRNPHATRSVSTLGPQAYFGEMSLMTGLERKASIVATRETECYVLEKGAFKTFIEHKVQLVEDISHVLAERFQELEAVRNRSTVGMASDDGEAQKTLVSRIKSFFQLKAGE